MSNTCPEKIRAVILDCVGEGVFTVDRDRRITCFNRAAEEITGVPRSEAVGRYCFDVLHGTHCEQECALQETIQTGQPVVCRGCYIVNAQGRDVPLSVSTAILTVCTDVRVIAATNRSLEQLVEEGVFRQDLYYRINVMRIQLPALRDRRSDIPLMVEHFVSKLNALQGKSIAGVSQRAMLLLMEHDYPGNVRELENAIEHAFVLCSGGLVEEYHLPADIRRCFGSPPTEELGDVSLRAMEVMHIMETLRRHGGNRDAAAEALGIHRATLFRKIKSFGLDVLDTDI